MYDAATYFAWFVFAVMFSVVVVMIVWLGSMPTKIAQNRNHPYVDAVTACSWFGLAFGGVGWVAAFVWSMVPVTFGDVRVISNDVDTDETDPRKIEQQIAQLTEQLKALKVKTNDASAS